MKRSYSRRELYALGEPLGDSATYRKAGGLVLGDGGGGGGGQAAAPDKTTQVSELPEWARPYAKDTLAKGAALTDINQNPYQTYGGNRIAGFSPLQQMSFQGAANMQPSQQLGTGTDLATAAGIGALGTNYQGGRFSGGTFGQGAADFYMNPYQQNVTDIGKREAARQSAIQGTQQQAQATQAGAFGGGRDAIMRAERERNLGQQMSDIQAQGSNAAFTNAQQQFNADQARRMQAQQLGEQSRQYGAGLGMQGLQTALQGAGQLGQLGGQQFQQGMDINRLQSAYGGQMQQQAQRPLDMAYQDFQNQQNYPYKQLGFMSDMIRGLPLGQQSTTSMYEQGPGMTQTLAGLGGAAYGFGKSGLFGKEGGLMTSYAEGGDVKTYAGDEGSVTSQDNKDSIVEGMYSMEGLQKAKQAALARRDIDTAEAIDERIAQLNAIQAQSASLDRGLGSAFDQIPEERQETMMAANGGIVAFAEGGSYGNQLRDRLKSFADLSEQQPKAQTAEELEQGAMNRLPMLERMMGPDATIPFAEELKAKREKLPEQMEKDQGLAIAMASLGLLARKKRPGESQKGQLISGLGEAGQQFAGEVGRLKKENREADEKIRQSQLLIATAQQQRKEGMAGKAIASEEKADDKRQDAFKAKADIQGKAVQLLATVEGNELQAATSRYASDQSLKGQLAQVAAHRETANRPGEFERMLGDYEKRMGRKLTPTEYKEAMTEIGAARYGAKYTGPDKSPEQAAAIRDKAMKDGRVTTAELAIMTAGNDPVKKQAAQDEYNRILREVEQEIINRADTARNQKRPDVGVPGGTGTPSRLGKDVSKVGKPPDPEAIGILKQDPSGKNKKFFDDIYGPGAAAKVLGG
jgi:hypothetical protein